MRLRRIRSSRFRRFIQTDRCSGLNYDPKLHMRRRLDPIDLHVRHTSALANAIFRLAVPWIVPMRYDATLKLFPNYKELW
jgi:hypothetical protein